MRSSLLVGIPLVVAATAAFAQQPAAPAAPVPQPLDSGAVAPDFSLPGSSAGALSPIHLSDYRGKTVVVAFFFKSRTRG